MPIPNDFPREPGVSAVAGSQPKILVRLDSIDGRYRASPGVAEIHERFEVCEELVMQLVAKCSTNRGTKYRNLSEVQILERLLGQLLGSGWGTEAEMQWVMRRTAAELGWEIPEDETALRAMMGYGL